jgi:hypothetical protein
MSVDRGGPGGLLVGCGPSTFELHGYLVLPRLLSVPDGSGGGKGLRA